MDHVNEDMDELFRKAGELYPLKTTNSDWDTVIGKLGSADEAGQSGLSGGDRKNHRWRWLLLLIPAALGGALYTVHLHNTSLALASANTKHHPQSVIVQQEKSSQGDPSAKSIANKDSRAGGGAKEIFAKTGNDVDQALASHATSAPAYSNQGKAADFSTQAINIKGENLSAANGLVKVQAIRLGKAYNQEMPGTANGESPIRQQTNSPKTLLAAAGQAGGSFPGIADKSYVYRASVVRVSDKFDKGIFEKYEAIQEKGKNMPALGASSLAASAPPGGLSAKSKTKKAQVVRGMYIGLAGGPDVSSVDFQTVKQTGFSLGMLAGYRFNQRLAVESGFFWDKKYYYSAGNYFNKQKVGIPNYVNILSLEGNCSMFEIPLALRYDIFIKKNHSFFVKAGLSSYLMNQENYAYQAELWGWQYQKDSTYNHSTNNIFSILQIGAAYEQRLGKNTRIRIEPYFRIPIQGIGVGSLPVSSAGLHLGITHSFR